MHFNEINIKGERQMSFVTIVKDYQKTTGRTMHCHGRREGEKGGAAMEFRVNMPQTRFTGNAQGK